MRTEAYWATIQVKIRADSHTEALDKIADLLHKEAESAKVILDWDYFYMGHQALYPTRTIHIEGEKKHCVTLRELGEMK